MFEAINGKAPEFAHLSLVSDTEGGKLSKRLGAMSVKDIQEQEGLEPMAIISLLARLGTSDPIEPHKSVEALIESFDFSKFSRSTPKFDSDELLRLNAKILHDTSFAEVKDKLAVMGLDHIDEVFWNGVSANLERLKDVQDWWEMANGNVTPIIDAQDKDFMAQACDLLPPAPWNNDTFSTWTKSLKEKTGRKGKGLFMPLRKALTGMEHGPELAVLLPLLGEEKTKKRLG
jgi:glutamyl-tRNA synthetase